VVFDFSGGQKSYFYKQNSLFLFLKNIKEQKRQGGLIFFVSHSPVKLKKSHKHQKFKKKYSRIFTFLNLSAK
jgi:hypothetical protein